MNPVSAIVLAAALSGHVVTLDDAVHAAESRQPVVQQMHATTAVFDARADEARAPLLPQVVANASYERGTANGAVRPGSPPSATPALPTSAETYGTYNFGVTATQLVYDFGQTIGTYRAAKDTAQAQALTERATVISSVGAARAAFFVARADKEMVGVAQASLDAASRHLLQTQGFIDAKTKAPIELFQAKQDVATGRYAVASAQAAYASAKATLNQAMGVEGGTDYEVADDTMQDVAGEDGPIAGLINEALVARPEFAALEKQLAAAGESESAAKGSYGPSISVSTTFSAAGAELDALAPNWNAMATVTWPLFTGFATPAKVREAQANGALVVAQRDQLRQQVRADVERSVAGVTAAKSSLEAAGEALVNANERLRLAEERYQQGVGTAIEIGDAETAETTTASQKVQAEFALSSARALLLQTLGRTPR